MKTVFVTGASGYIGKHVVNALLDMKVNVSTINYKNRSIDPRVTVYDCDIFGNYNNIFEIVGKPDVCLHLAWTDGFIHNSDNHLKKLYSHYKFIENMVQGGLQQVAVLGTMHEIGYHVGEITEETPANPHSLYGVAKNSLRQSLDTLLKDKEVTFQWLRAYYITGDDTNSKSIFSKLIQAEQEGKELFPFTTGENMYDFISVEELGKQIALSVLQTDITGIINCCSGSPISLRDRVERFLIDNEFRIKLNYGVFPDRPYDSPAVWGNADKIKHIMSNSECAYQSLN
ncbi:MAG: NAD(P)-dependent oxidoreductase [Candidatus Pristimantibacillus lignocellulolyticus]|uniref:NAD(P)-dependent oxidoreductase n=1 Tax=Candidatus Pristimantibacillus lignocellulolyticus TaxID=2994561 RepID=A0A9J6ZGV8_9BACL|nr:MAG: NAD(P)-dependent oxidoreductase [Candidatus Pristimantibacillus lignocellulolyticus]